RKQTRVEHPAALYFFCQTWRSRRAGDDRGLGFLDCAWGSDMHPHAFETQAEEAARPRGAVEQNGKGERAVGRIGEQRGRQDGGTRIDEWHDLPLGAAAQSTVGRERKVAAAFIA